MMQHLGRHAIKNLLFRRRTPSIRFSGTLTSPELNDTLHSQVMARGQERWKKVTPPLDEWLKQGKEINPKELRGLINALCESQRFNHALQVSEWITKRRVFNLSPEDFASRLYLVEIHSGLREAEKFFKSIPENMRDDSVYNTLLSMYTKSKNTRHEAEATYQKMREQNMLSKPYPYYNMIALYGLLGDRNMVDEIVRQMKENGVEHDKILTDNNVVKAYASVPDVEAMEKFLMGLEVQEPGLSKKTIEMLRRTELVVDAESKDTAYKVLMKIYGDAGAKQDESRLYRLIYPNNKKRERMRAHINKGDGGGDSYHPTHYYDDGGDDGGEDSYHRRHYYDDGGEDGGEDSYHRRHYYDAGGDAGGDDGGEDGGEDSYQRRHYYDDGGDAGGDAGGDDSGDD